MRTATNSMPYCGPAMGRTSSLETEKGEVLVWSIAEGRITRRLNQGSPVHALIFAPDGKQVIAAGGEHFEAARSSVVRKWNLEDGSFEDWRAFGNESIGLLAADAGKSVVAVAPPATLLALPQVDIKGHMRGLDGRIGGSYFTYIFSFLLLN
jgi:WD40 repeat protein